MRIRVLFPTFDRREAAVDLVRQLVAQTHADFDITCVDHGTTAVDFSSVDGAPLTVIRGGTNLWWTGAMNLGLAHILANAGRDDAVLIINDDVTIGPEYLATLAEGARSNPRAIIGSVCIDEATERVLYADLIRRPWRGYAASSYEGRPAVSVPKGLYLPCDVESGRGTLIPVAAFREVGLFDEARLPHYGADSEFSCRAKKRGFPLLCATDARVRTAAPPADSPVGYRSFLHFALDGKRAGRIKDKWIYYRVSHGTPQAVWATALDLWRLGKIYFRERRRGG